MTNGLSTNLIHSLSVSHYLSVTNSQTHRLTANSNCQTNDTASTSSQAKAKRQNQSHPVIRLEPINPPATREPNDHAIVSTSSFVLKLSCRRPADTN